MLWLRRGKNKKTLTLRVVPGCLHGIVEVVMTTEQWAKVSRLINFVMAQPTGAQQGITGPTEKPKRVKKEKPQPQGEQLRLF